jgi:signal transduction histidine kinase
VTVRRRLLLASLSTLALGLAVLVLLGNVLLRQHVGDQTEALLRERASAQLATLRVDNGRIQVQEAVNDDALDQQAWVLEGASVIERPATASPKLDRLAVAMGRRAQTQQRDVGHDTVLRVEPVRADDHGPVVGSVVVAVSVASVERLEQLVLIGSLIVAALVMVAGVVAIRTALDGALRPVARMTAQAEAWGANDLDQRFGLGPATDELTSLAATLDRLLARIAASRRHEQRFAAEIAHELRTPVAGIRGRAELALSSDAGPDEREQGLASIVDQTRRLTGTIDALLAVARREIDPAASSVDLEQLAREFEGTTIIAPQHTPRAEGETDVVRRVVAPLVDNARRHARERVTLELSTTDAEVHLTIRDDGPGVPAHLGDRVFDAGVREVADDSGAGLGLALARRLARSCGGDVRLCNGPGGCFVLALPIAPD